MISNLHRSLAARFVGILTVSALVAGCGSSQNRATPVRLLGASAKLPALDISAVSIGGDEASGMWILDKSQLYLSVDLGSTWKTFALPHDLQSQTISMNLAGPGRLVLAASDATNRFVSTDVLTIDSGVWSHHADLSVPSGEIFKVSVAFDASASKGLLNMSIAEPGIPPVAAVFATTDLGSTWDATPPTTEQVPGNVAFLKSPGVAIIVGGPGEANVYATTDAGKGWRVLPLAAPVALPKDEILTGVALAGLGNGIPTVVAQFSNSIDHSTTVMYQYPDEPSLDLPIVTVLGSFDTSASPPVTSIDSTGKLYLFPHDNGSTKTAASPNVIVFPNVISVPSALVAVPGAALASIDTTSCSKTSHKCDTQRDTLFSSDMGRTWQSLVVGSPAKS